VVRALALDRVKSPLLFPQNHLPSPSQTTPLLYRHRALQYLIEVETSATTFIVNPQLRRQHSAIMSSSPTTNTPGVSLWGLVDTLIPTVLYAGVYILIFLILRRSNRRWYAPRTYLGTLRDEYV
jgi:hypothetical protein